MNDDEVLLAEVRAGSAEAFAELVRRHQDEVFAVLGRYERDPHAVEDLAQETFLRVWKGLDRFDPRAPVAHWMCRIATRVALDHLRRQHRRRHEVSLDADGAVALQWLEHAAAPTPTEDQAFSFLHAALAALSPEDQLVLTLLEIDECSVKEAARRTGWSLVGVRVRAFRARRRLAGLLKTLLRDSTP